MPTTTSVTPGGLGWLPDLPDIRDYSASHPDVKQILAKAGVAKLATTLPASADLRQWCSPIYDQGSLGSCTANAGVGMIEFFERKAFGKYVGGSRLFLYKASRNLLHWTGDTGAYLRTVMGALALFGVPPDEYWPYDITNFDAEPTAFCYAFGEDYKAIEYYRLDEAGITKDALLGRIKTNLAASLPAIFGFTVYTSIQQSNANSGKIPMPSDGDKIAGGHAIVAVGYDDGITIVNSDNGKAASPGALLIRNSWGTG